MSYCPPGPHLHSRHLGLILSSASGLLSNLAQYFSVLRLQYLTLLSKINLDLTGLRYQAITLFPVSVVALAPKLKASTLSSLPQPFTLFHTSSDILAHKELTKNLPS